MKKSTLAVSGGLIVAAIVVAAWLWRREAAAPPALPARQPAAASAPALESRAASSPAVRYPIEAPNEQAAVEPQHIESALADVFGRNAVLALFQVDGFANRLVATVDNLGRDGFSPGSMLLSTITPRVETAHKQMDGRPQP